MSSESRNVRSAPNAELTRTRSYSSYTDGVPSGVLTIRPGHKCREGRAVLMSIDRLEK